MAFGNLYDKENEKHTKKSQSSKGGMVKRGNQNDRNQDMSNYDRRRENTEDDDMGMKNP